MITLDGETVNGIVEKLNERRMLQRFAGYLGVAQQTQPGWNREQGWMVGKKKHEVGAERSGATIESSAERD